MTKRLVMIDLTDEEWAWLGVMQAEIAPRRTPVATVALDEFVSSIVRAVVADDVEEERKRAA